jgi:predicted RNase H-like HicB family nuclease
MNEVTQLGEALMKTIRYVYWQDQEMWLGYLEEFPDYMTQGESLQDLQEHLKDLYDELTSGRIPGVRRIAELQIA